MKLHLPVLLRKALLACFAFAFACSAISAAADLTLGGDESLTIDYADTDSIPDLAGGTLQLSGDTILLLSNCGSGDGKTYTLLTGVGALLDAEGNAITLDSTNNAISNYFDITPPGAGFWENATLQLTHDGSLQFVRYDSITIPSYEKSVNVSAVDDFIPYSSTSTDVVFKVDSSNQEDKTLVIENLSSPLMTKDADSWFLTSVATDKLAALTFRNVSIQLFQVASEEKLEFSCLDSISFESIIASSSYRYDGTIHGELGSTITFSNNGVVLFEDCNTTRGGAIFLAEGGGNVSLNNNGCVIFHSNWNGAYGYGGAIYVDQGGGTLSLNDNGSVDFRDNTTTNVGGAIFAYLESKVTLNNNGILSFSGNRSAGRGGAIAVWTSFTPFEICNNGSVVFSKNEANVSGAAIHLEGPMNLSNNGSVRFLENTSYTVRGAVALEGGIYIDSSFLLHSNENVSFEGNVVYGNPYSLSGAAIYMESGKLFIQNNQSVFFQKNYVVNESLLRFRSVYVSDAEDEGGQAVVRFSAPESGKIEFRDSIRFDVDSNSASAFYLNALYTNEYNQQIAQTGDIIFTGAYVTEKVIKDILDKHQIQASADEIAGFIKKSKTSEVWGTMQLHDGRLIIRDGAIMESAGIVVHSSTSQKSTPTMLLHHGTLTSNGDYSHRSNVITISGDSALELAGQNVARYSAITMSDGSYLIVNVDNTHTTNAALTLRSSTLTISGALTLHLNAADGLVTDGRYMLLSGVSEPTDWASHITVSGGVWSIDDLSWVNNTLYLNYPTLTEATWNNASGDRVWNVDSSVNWEQHELNWAYRNGIGVIFGDEGAGTVSLVGELAPDSVLVDSTKDYTWEADTTESGKLTGDMSLTKEGTGKLTIQTSNSYTGGTEIKGGVLVVDNPKALGTGEVVLNGGTLEIAVTGLANTLANTGTSTLKVSNGKTHSLAGIIDNSGELTLEGLFDATALATAIGETHIDANGQEGNSGFLKTAGKEVDIMSGSGTLVNNGTVSIDGTTVALDSTGYGKTGAELQLGTYTIVDGTHSVAAILDKSTSANIILNAGGTLTADASTNELTATGGVINMNEAIELGGSISGAVLNVSAGKLTATLEGENTLNATGWNISQAITNNGTLKLTGTVDATALATVIAQTHIDATGQEGNSGFLKTAGKEVDIMTGSGTLVNNGTVSIGGTNVTLDAGGYGKTGAELQLGTYTIVDGTHSVEAILRKSATANIILNTGGTLTADANTEALTATGGIINMRDAIELGGSISGAVLNVSAGKLTATLEGENTLNATGWNISQAITNNGTLKLTGTVDATALATVIAQTHIDATGQEGNSGFLKTAGMEVDIMTGSGTLVNNGTVSIGGTNVTLDAGGYGKTGAELQLCTYTIVDGTHSVEAILRKSATANIILEAGTLTADASTEALTATGGIINMSDAIELGGSISGAVLNVSAGKLTAALEGENTLNATGWNISQAITNIGTLKLTGTVDATALATTIGETHIDATGQEGNSGFLKTAGKEVDIMSGSGTLVNNGTVSIDGTTVTLDDKGYGKTGAELQLGTYTIVDGTHSVEAILRKSATANIILEAGTLTADASTDALTATGGIINMSDAIELGGSISGTELNVSAGKLTATLSGENTLNATRWQMSQAITNNGTLTLSGTVDATALATAIGETHIDANGQEGNSGFLKTAGMEVDIVTGSGTLVNNGTVSIGGTNVTLDAGGYGKTGAELQLGTYTIVDGTHNVEAILGKSATANIILEAGTLTADASTDALTATGGVINMNEAIELGGSISGAVLNVSAGKLTAALEGENTLNATGWLLNQTITNNGTLNLTGTVDATALATAIGETHIDANGQEGNSGFLKTAGKEVDIMSGSGALVNNGTVSIDGTTVEFDSTGYGKTGAELQLGTYTIVDGTHSVAAILDKSTSANIILNTGGTLTADASTEALTATGGVINMSDAIELGGSISGAELNVSAGKLTAALEGENTLNATGWLLNQTITNNGTLNLTGTVDATALATVIAQTHIDANGQEGNSGFLKTAGKEVDIMSGSGALVNNGAVSIDGTTVVLDSTGYGKIGTELQLGTYTIVDGTHSVEAILGKSATANIILEAGTLTADASTDALTATGGTINMDEAVELGGSIRGTELNISAGKLTAVLSGENTLHATGWQMDHTITNNGTLNLTGTVDATALATVIDETHIDANGQEGNSGFLKTAGMEVDIMTGSGTLVNNGSVSIDATTVTLDSTGYGKTGAELQLGTYTIVDGTHSVAAILDKSTSANIILNTGGTLTADASTEALTAMGGVINMSAAIELGGSISGAELNVLAGKLTATLVGENTLNATGWNISQTIINTGTLTLSGSFDASALQLNKTEAGRLSLSGERVGLTESGFSQGVEYTVLIVDGGSTVNAGAGISHKDYLSRTQLVLGEDGVARAGAEVDYTHFFLTGGDSAEVSKIAEVAERNQVELNGVTMDSGLLTVDQSITVSATGGSIVLTEAATLGGVIENTAVSSAAGDYVAEISARMEGDSTLNIGGGTITVSGDNSYTGGTTVNGGTLLAGNAQAFGTGDVVVNNATLDLNQFLIANKVFMNGSSTLGYADGASHIVLGSEAAVNFRNGYTLGRGKQLTVAGAATYTGALTLGGGTLELGGQLTVQGDVVFASGATTTLDISGWKGLDDGDVLVDFGSSNSGYADGSLTLEGIASDWELAFDAASGVLTVVAVKDEPMPEPEPEPMPEPVFAPELNRNQQVVYDTIKDIMGEGTPGGLLGELGKEITNTRDEEKLKELLDALGGAEYATLMSSQQDAARGHMRRLRGSMGSGHALAGTNARAYIEAYTNRADVDGDSSGRGYEMTENGGQFVLEFHGEENVSGGLAVASGRTKLQPDGGLTQKSSNTYVDAFLVCREGGYTGKTSLGVGVHSYDLERNVMGNAVSAQTDGSSVNFMHESAYEVAVDEVNSVQFFGALESSMGKLGTFLEKGADTASLQVESQDAWMTTLSAGARYHYRFAAVDAAPAATLSLQAGLEYKLGDTESEAEISFSGARSHSFRQSGSKRDSFGYNVGASLHVPVSARAAIYASGDAVLRGDSREVNANLGVQVAF